jgi:hypothetical protein
MTQFSESEPGAAAAGSTVDLDVPWNFNLNPAAGN